MNCEAEGVTLGITPTSMSKSVYFILAGSTDCNICMVAVLSSLTIRNQGFRGIFPTNSTEWGRGISNTDGPHTRSLTMHIQGTSGSKGISGTLGIYPIPTTILIDDTIVVCSICGRAALQSLQSVTPNYISYLLQSTNV